MITGVDVPYVKNNMRQLKWSFLVVWPVSYAENFHGGFRLLACGGHLYLVSAVFDATI